jgi:hypothetical protein
MPLVSNDSWDMAAANATSYYIKRVWYCYCYCHCKRLNYCKWGRGPMDVEDHGFLADCYGVDGEQLLLVDLFGPRELAVREGAPHANNNHHVVGIFELHQAIQHRAEYGTIPESNYRLSEMLLRFKDSNAKLLV